MNKEQAEVIIKYVDTKIEYEFAGLERDEDGCSSSCVEERKAMESAKDELMKA